MMSIAYRLADCAADYAACHAIMRENNCPAWKLHFPTVLAVKDDKIIGFLSTQKCSWAVLAGPFEFKSGKPPHGIIMIRLIEAYEVVLRTLGLVQYSFRVSRKPEKGKWLRQVQTIQPRVIKVTSDFIYFTKDLGRIHHGLAA